MQIPVPLPPIIFFLDFDRAHESILFNRNALPLILQKLLLELSVENTVRTIVGMVNEIFC